jgi:Fe-S oxidoreductase
MRAAVLLPCLSDGLCPRPGQSVVTLPNRPGCEAGVSGGQACYGQVQAGSGGRPASRRRTGRRARVPGGSGAVVTPSPSRAGMIGDPYPGGRGARPRFPHVVIAEGGNQ